MSEVLNASDAAAFLAKIIADPDEDTHRLVYADWLQEQPTSQTCPSCQGNGFTPATVKLPEIRERLTSDGRTERYQLLPPFDFRLPKCATCRGSGSVPDTTAQERADFIRLQVEYARGPSGFTCTSLSSINKRLECLLESPVPISVFSRGMAAEVRCETPHGWVLAKGSIVEYWTSGTKMAIVLAEAEVFNWRPELRERLLQVLSPRPTWSKAIPGSGWSLHRNQVFGGTMPVEVWRRGFIERVTCTAADWIAYGDAVRLRNPVTQVTLNTFPKPMEMHAFAQEVGYGDSPGNRIDVHEMILGMKWKGTTFKLPR